PALDLDVEAALQRLLVAAAARGLLRSAHDVSSGGLVTTLVETCLPAGLGAEVVAEPGVAPHQWLFSESPSRVVVSVAPDEAAALADLATAHGVPAVVLGQVSAERRLRVEGVVDLDLDEVREVVERALPEALGEPEPPQGA